VEIQDSLVVLEGIQPRARQWVLFIDYFVILFKSSVPYRHLLRDTFYTLMFFQGVGFFKIDQG